jgi:membrane-associated phospholipid phosphatase
METKVARGITFLIHPLLIPTYVLLVLLNLNVFVSHSVPITYRLALTGMVFLTTFVFPLFFTWLLYRLEMISSLLLIRREERIYPILAISIFYYATYYLLKGIHLSTIFSYYMLGATLLALLSLVINFYGKISLHMVATGSFTGLLLGLSLNFGVNLNAEICATIVVAGIVGYARLKSGMHKPAEIYSGFAVGAIVMTLLIILL